MDDNAINDLFSHAQSLGYKDSRDKFINLIHTDQRAFNDMFSYARSKGFNKGQDDFSILIGKTNQGPGKDRPGSGAGASGGLRLPSNLNKQQVKTYLGKYGASLTDAQYDQIAREVSGKSLDEAMSIANSIATAPVRTQFAPAWQPAQTNEAAAPEFNLNKFVAEEVQRPKTAQELEALKESQFETQRNVMISARDQYISETENNMISLADDVISGKIAQLDLGPLGTYDIGSLEKETGIFSKLKDNPILLKSKVTDYIKNGAPLKDISAEKVLPYLDSYANIRELKKQNEARIQNINNELEFISQNPNVDQNVIDGLKADLKKEKSIQNVVNPSISALYDQLDIIDAAPIALKGLGLSLWDPFLSLANGLVEQSTILFASNPAAVYLQPVLKEKVKQAKAENDIRMQNLQFKEKSDQSILDGLNLMNVSRTTGQTIGSMGAIFAGGLAAGPIGAGYMGFTLVYGDSLDEARKSGFSEAESQLYATIYGTASAALEAFGFKGVANAFMNTAVKKQILSTIRSMMASGATKDQILKEVMDRGLQASMSFLKGATPEALTEMAQTSAEFGTKKAFNLLATDAELGEKGFELPTLEEGFKQIAEAGIIGGVFGGFVPGVKSLTRSKKNEYKNLAKSVVKGDVSQESLKNNVATLVNTGSITQQQGTDLMQNIEIAVAAKNSLPTYITDGAARERGVELILERNKIAEEMNKSDEDLQDGYKQRLSQIKAELKTISDNKWKAPVDPVITTTVAGLETMTQSLSTHPEPDTAARIFTESLNTDRGMLAVLADAMAAGKEIAAPVIERASVALSALADAFESNPKQTEYTKAAASQAREMADRLSQYTTKVASVTNGKIPSLNVKEILGRIKAGIDAGTIDFMEGTPDEIAMTFSDIMDGKDVSEEDAKAVADFLYGKYKQIMDFRTNLQNKIEEESSPEKKERLRKSVQAVNEVLSRLNVDIESTVKYQQEKALQDEAAGTRKKAPLGKPKQESDQEQAPTPAQEFDPRNIDQVADDYQQKTGDVLTGVMATALKTVAKLLAKIAPNVKFYVHSTTQEFLDAVKQEGVNEDLSKNAGAVVQSDDGTVESLHINLELALSESTAKAAKYVYHEAAHVLLGVYFRSDKYRGADMDLIFDMAKAIRSALPSKYKGPLAEFVGRYKDKLVYEQEEEFIAELIDMLANDEANLDKPTISKIIAVINDFITAACEKFGVDPEKFLLSNNRADLIDFVNSTSRAVKSGLSSDLSEKAITKLQRKYAVQEQATGEVPVQSRTKSGRTLAKGESKTGSQETAQEAGQKEFTKGFPSKEIDLAVVARELLSKAKDAINKSNLRSATKYIDSIRDVFPFSQNIVIDSNKTQSEYEQISRIFPKTELQQGDVVLDTGASKESVFVRSDSDKKMGSSGFRKRTDLTKNERAKTINGEPVVVSAIYRTSSKIKNRILEITSGKAFVDDNYLEITGSNEAFHKLISKGRANLGALGQTVLIRDKSAYKDMRLFVSEDGTSGFAITNDNRLISVWNDAKNGKPRRLPQIMYLAIQEGASKLECFDTGLVDMYANYGFRPIGRFSFSEFKTPTPWVDEYGNNQSGWQYDGEPDIVYMVYDGGNRSDIAFNIEATSKQTTSGIPWVDKDEIGSIQEYIATGNPVVIKNNEPKNEGKKTKSGRTAKKSLKPNDLFQINAAPFYRTSLSDYTQAESLHRSMAYNSFLDEFQEAASNFNVKIAKITKAIGGWDGQSEVSALFDVKGTWDDVVALATVMGAMAPEVQDSTIAGQMVKPGSKDHEADRWDIEVDDPSIAFSAIREVSFEQDGYTISGNTIILLDFGKGDSEFIEKTLTLINTIEQYGGQIKSREKKAIKSDLIEDKNGRRQEAIERLKKSAIQREGDRGPFYNFLEKANERLDAFIKYKKIEVSPEAAEVARLRKEQMESLATGEEMSQEKVDRLNEVSDSVVEKLIPIFAIDQSLYSKAKEEIEAIAQDAIDILSGRFGFVSEFGIKKPARAAVKTVRWYDSMPTRLGDGARTNIIVNTEPDADFIFDMMSAKFTDDLRRRERPEEGTELGYPKRLIEIMTKSGKLAEVQVMTPRGYLAKDGAAEFPVNQIQYAVDYLNQIRDILGWQIPDGVGHYFYEIHRDPQTPKKLRDEAEVISKEYYKAMLRPEQSTLTDQQFRDAISEFKAKVDAADKSKWDRGNLGIAPSSLNDYLDNKPAKTTEQYVKEKEAKEKERQPGKKIKSGIIGQNAQLAQDVRDNLQVARDMEASGKGAKAIRIATGWERGKDEKWRYEIEDVDIIGDLRPFQKGFQGEGYTVSLGDFAKGGVLSAYPQLKDRVTIVRGLPSSLKFGVAGSLSKTRNGWDLYLSDNLFNGDVDYGKSVLLHEIQHAIQDIEGFAKGGTVKGMTTPNEVLQTIASPSTFPKLGKEQRALAREKTRSKGLSFSEVFYFDVISDDPERIEDAIEKLEILNEISPNETYTKLIEGLDYKLLEMRGENVAFKKYQRLAGEVEARNVQKRAEYTPEQRRERTLQETEDVAREDQIVIFGVDEASSGKKTKSGRTKAGSFKNGYDPNEAADRGNQEDRDLQKRIYDAALEVWDSTKDLMDLSADIYEAVSDKLGIGLNPIHIGELVKDLRTGNRPEYSKNQEGKYKRSKTRQREGSVMASALEALERLATDRRVNKGIISSLTKALKGGPQYTVEGQMDIESIADALFDIFGGATNLTALQELYNIAEVTKGGLRSFMFARIANDAWNKARESKDQQEKLEYRNIGNKAVMQLGQEATEAGRFNAMIYRIQKLNPEFLAAYQKTHVREETESQMRSSGKKKSNVVSATTALNTAQTQAAQQATSSPSVQAAINTATGTPPSISTPPPAPKSKPGAPKPPAPAPAPSATKVIDDRIKELKGKLKDLFSGKKTKSARVLPASMNPEILDIITELARNYIKKGMTDRTALISKINGDVTAAGGSITMDYFTEMWNEVQGEAVQQRNGAVATSLANRIVGKVKGAIRTSTNTFDPIAELITNLVNKATEDVKMLKKDKESPLEIIKRLVVEYDTAKKIWEASKAKVEAKIDGLDPAKFPQSEKDKMKKLLDNFFENDLSYFEIKKTPTAAPDATVRNAIKQEMKDKKLKIEEILLTANSKKAATRDQFIQNIVDDIVYSTGISYSDAIRIAEDFTRKYDQIVTQKQESILKRYSSQRRVNNIKKKSQGQRAFEMIKYGALDPSIEIHDKDGNIIDSAMLLAEIFGIPYLDQEARDMLDGFAEVIADTPEGIIRQQVINDMMLAMKMHYYRQLGSLGDRIMSQFYANLLTSTDTLLKAFNSNVLMNPFEYLSIATRAAVKGDFALIPLLTRGFYQQKGVGSVKELKATKTMSDVDGYVINNGESYYLFNDKTIMSLANPKAVALSSHYEGLLRYSASINQARGVLENIVLHENFTNNVTGAVYEKYAKSRSGRAWGKYVTIAQKGLGALDALVTAGATDARYSDLLFDAIRHYAKINGQKIKGSEIVKIINLLKGYSPMVQLDAYNQAIAEMEIVEGGQVDLSDRKKKTLLLLRVEEIVREKMKDRYQQAVNEYPWLSGLEQQEIADMLDEAGEISTKLGLMGTPPGTSGVLSHLLGLPGKTVRFSNMQYGAFAKAPVNAANFLLQGNTPLAAFILSVRLLKSERGLGLGSNEFFKREGIRTKMYGKTSYQKSLSGNQSLSLKWNLEKQDLITKFVLIQAPVITMTFMASNAVMVALASMFDDDDDRDKLLKDGIGFLRTIPQKDRELMFFGDPLSPDPKKKAGIWKTLPFYATGAMYGYSDGGYGKMQSLRARFGVEPYTVYSYGRKIFSYKDNPLLGAFFMEMAAATDAMLFNETADLEDTQLGMIMASTWSQMNLIRDQSNLRSISEVVELLAGQRAYEGLDGYNARAQMYLSKTSANILNNLALPAEMKNLNQDIMAMIGQYMDDPKQFHEFVVYRWPIIGNAVIEGDKTGPFGYPLKMQPKRVFPIGTEQFKLPLMLDGSLDVPTVDQLLSTEDAAYTALFERNKNDRFLKPGISGYYKLNKYGDYERETFTLEEQKKIREEYKLLMREFAEENIGLTQSPKEFDIKLKIFLGQYGAETGKNRVQTTGYKRYIVNKVMGSKASDILLDEADGLYNMNEDQLILDKIKQTEEGFEPLPR